MKHLFLNRHAKSDWNSPGLNDFERPLNERGMKHAPMMGMRLHENEPGIELIISSPAKRAITTASITAEKLNYPLKNIRQEPSIYDAKVQDLLSIVNDLDDELSSVLMFGHNPGFTDFADYLTGSGILNIPTGGICKIIFNLDSWKEVSAHTGHLEYFDFPKREIAK